MRAGRPTRRSAPAICRRSGVKVRSSVRPDSAETVATPAKSSGDMPVSTKRMAASRDLAISFGVANVKSKRKRKWRRAAEDSPAGPSTGVLRFRETTSTDWIRCGRPSTSRLEVGDTQALDWLSVASHDLYGDLHDGHAARLVNGGRLRVLARDREGARENDRHRNEQTLHDPAPASASNFRARRRSSAKRPGGAVATN